MAEIRETHVERDEEGRVTDTRVRVERVKEKRSGGFGLGLLLGVILIGGGLLAFGYSQGSFENAGREADQVAAVAQEELDQTAQVASEELREARADTDQAAEQLSETATN